MSQHNGVEQESSVHAFSQGKKVLGENKLIYKIIWFLYIL